MNNVSTIATDPMTEHMRLQTTAMRELGKHTPMNDFGLPIGVYRVDMLPFYDYRPATSVGEPWLEDVDEKSKQLDALGTSTEDPQTATDQEFPDVDDGEIVQVDDVDAFESMETSVAVTESSVAVPTEDLRVAGFKADSLDHAFVYLHYDEGFPAFENGQSFWQRFDFEPAEAFEAFAKYLDLGQGVRGSDEDHDEDAEIEEVTGMRSIALVAEESHQGGTELLYIQERYRHYYDIYYWGARAKAYDLFRVAQHRKQQELRALQTQDDHYLLSQKLMKRLAVYMDDDEEFWDMMTPKTGIDLLKTLTGLQRVSAGIPAAGPVSAKDGSGGGESLEVHLRQVSQGNNVQELDATTEDKDALRRVLEDPEMAANAQDLILKINRQQQ